MQLARAPVWANRLAMAALVLIGLMAAHIAWQDLANQISRLKGASDPACGMNFCDTALFWLAGRLSRAGDLVTLYNADSFTRAAALIQPGQRLYLPFVYPPPILIPASLLSMACLKTAYVVTTCSLTGASCWLFRRAGISWFVIALGLLSPAGLWAIYLGQLGVVGAAILLTGLTRLAANPGQSGALLSLLSLKPQYAILVPVILLAGRHWRAGVAFAAGTIGMFALSWIWPGPSAWHAFATAGRAAETSLLQAPFGPGYELHGASIFWMLRSLSASLPAAYAGQTFSALLAASLAWRLWRRTDPNRVALTLCLILLVTPYGFTDDMVGYSVAAVMLLRPDAPLRNAVLAALWLAPGYSGHVAAMTGFLLTPLLSLTMIAIGLTTPALPATTARRSGWARPLPQAPHHSPL